MGRNPRCLYNSKIKSFLESDQNDWLVNLDENRLSGVMKFLDDITKEYQMVNFCCHQSR